MKPVKQDIFVNDPQGRPGNCLQACIASILELKLEEVPHFVTLPDDEWFAFLCNWLYDQGYEVEDFDSVWETDDFMLVVGPSPRSVSHAVVYKNGELVHDPHPSDVGILEVKWCMAIYKIT